MFVLIDVGENAKLQTVPGLWINNDGVDLEDDVIRAFE